jgi:hypothetical protein
MKNEHKGVLFFFLATLQWVGEWRDASFPPLILLRAVLASRDAEARPPHQ